MKKNERPELPDRVSDPSIGKPAPYNEMRFEVPIRRVDTLVVKIEPYVYDGFDGRELKVSVYVSDGEGLDDEANFYRLIGSDDLRSRLSLLMYEAEKVIEEALGQFDAEGQEYRRKHASDPSHPIDTSARLK